jgi:hypothetical protein
MFSHPFFVARRNKAIRIKPHPTQQVQPMTTLGASVDGMLLARVILDFM